MNLKAFEFAALKAAPQRYDVILNDCVKFAKKFCVHLLSYCSNARDLEAEVNRSIGQATTSGLNVEQLSRQVRSSDGSVIHF